MSCIEANINTLLYKQINKIADLNNVLQFAKKHKMGIFKSGINNYTTMNRQIMIEFTFITPLIQNLYKSIVIDNDLYFIVVPTFTNLGNVLKFNHTIEWWCVILYQIARAVYFLESKGYNHNNLNPNTICFHKYSQNYSENLIMLTNFNNVHKDEQPGKDLQNFLTGIVQLYNFPRQLKEKLNDITNFSGKSVSRWFLKNFPFVSTKYTELKLNRIFGAAFGAVIGELLKTDNITDESFNTIKNAIENFDMDDYKSTLFEKQIIDFINTPQEYTPDNVKDITHDIQTFALFGAQYGYDKIPHKYLIMVAKKIGGSDNYNIYKNKIYDLIKW